MAQSWLPSANGFMPMDQGWDGWVKSPDISPDDKGELTNGATALLSFSGADGSNEMIGLWINDVQFTFGLAGTEVQSKARRSFFPHNFVAPVAQFSGQCPNQYEYNRLSQFIRQSQLNYMRGVDLNQGRGLRLVVLDPTADNDESYPQRGNHGRFDAYGYILNAPAGAERWVNAPTYTFNFTVTDVQGGNWLSGVVKDDISQALKMESITNLFLQRPDDTTKGTGFVTAKEVQQLQAKNKKKKSTTREKGNSFPPSQLGVNGPFTPIGPIKFVVETEQGPVPVAGPNAGKPLDIGTNPSGG